VTTNSAAQRLSARVLSQLPASNRGLWALLAGYVALRVIVVAKGHVFTSYDTASYALRGDPLLNHGALVSLTGGAPRLWGVPVFYAILPSDMARAVAQWALATLAWAVLAWVIWTLLRHPAAKVVGSGSILLLALLNQVGNWDFAILSESLTISLGVLVLGLLLRWMTTGSVWMLVATVAVAFWWTFTRADISVFTLAVVSVLVFFAWRQPQRRRASVIAAAVLVIAVAWCSAITPRVYETHRQWGSLGVDASEELYYYRLRVLVFGDARVKTIFSEELGMPACPGADAVAARPTWDVEDFFDAYHDCPELVAWGERNRDGLFLRFAAAAPGEYTRMNITLVEQSMMGATLAVVPTIVPGPIHRLIFPGHPWTLPVVVGGFAVALAAALLLGAMRGHRRLTVAALVLAAACAVSTAAGVLLGGGEFWRFGIQEAIGWRISVILLVSVAVDLGLDRLRARRAAEAIPPPQE